MVPRRKLTIDGVIWHFCTLSDNRGIALWGWHTSFKR